MGEQVENRCVVELKVGIFHELCEDEVKTRPTGTWSPLGGLE